MRKLSPKLLQCFILCCFAGTVFADSARQKLGFSQSPLTKFHWVNAGVYVDDISIVSQYKNPKSLPLNQNDPDADGLLKSKRLAVVKLNGQEIYINMITHQMGVYYQLESKTNSFEPYKLMNAVELLIRKNGQIWAYGEALSCWGRTLEKYQFDGKHLTKLDGDIVPMLNVVNYSVKPLVIQDLSGKSMRLPKGQKIKFVGIKQNEDETTYLVTLPDGRKGTIDGSALPDSFDIKLCD